MIFVFVSVNTSPKRRVNVDATRGPTRVGMTQKYDTIATSRICCAAIVKWCSSVR
jgi:hypothetical protein